MGELLLSEYLRGTSLTVSSAGTHGLPSHEIDPSSGRLMRSAGIDPSQFRSRRLTADLAQSADLILCFEARHRKDIVTVTPSATSRTFLLSDFAALSKQAAADGVVTGITIQERLGSIISAAPLLRSNLPAASEIADPHGREFPAFQTAATQINDALHTILRSLEK
jgi:protein-tyrosine phosphatase